MIFKPQNGTPEQLSYLRRCAEMVLTIIQTKAFSKQVDSEIVKGLREYKEADVMFFYRDSMIGGMANEDQNLIRLNTKFFGNNFERDCSTLVHEWLHLLGHDHISSLDLSSVPYAVGAIVQKMVREGMNPDKINPRWIFAGIVLVAIILYFTL